MDALVLARQVENEAAELGDPVSYARALALQGKLLLAQGAVQEACTTATRLEVASPESDNAFVVVAIATFQAQLAFFLGSYRDAITQARDAGVSVVLQKPLHRVELARQLASFFDPA